MRRPPSGWWLLAAALLSCRDETKQEVPEDAKAQASASAAGPAPSASGSAAQASAPTPRATCLAGIEALVATFDEPFAVELYATRTLPKLAAAADDVAHLMEGLAANSKGRLTFRTIDTTRDEAAKEAAKKAGLQETPFGEASGPNAESATITQGYFGLVFRYGPEQDAIPVLDANQRAGVEFWVANKMRELRDKADEKSVRIGVVTGKDEIALTEPNLVPDQGGPGPTMQGVLTQALPFYKLETVSLGAEIDPTLSGVIVTQPGKDFSDDELRRLDELVMKGRSLVVVASALNMPAWDPLMRGTLHTHRLEKLLDGYGVELRRELLLDPTNGLRLPFIAASGATEYYTAPGLLQLQRDDRAAATEQVIDAEFGAFFRLDEILFPYASPLVPHPERQPTARLRVVARTSAEAVASGAESVELGLAKPDVPEGARARHAIAIAVEGTLASAFGAGSSAAPARVLVISSAQFFANPFARAGNAPPPPAPRARGDEGLQKIAMVYARSYLTATVLTFKNTLDWMSADERLIACSALVLEPAPARSDAKKTCTKEQMLKLVESGLSVDDALEVCAKQK
jgi:hypothetical protein